MTLFPISYSGQYFCISEHNHRRNSHRSTVHIYGQGGIRGVSPWRSSACPPLSSWIILLYKNVSIDPPEEFSPWKPCPDPPDVLTLAHLWGSDCTQDPFHRSVIPFRTATFLCKRKRVIYINLTDIRRKTDRHDIVIGLCVSQCVSPPSTAALINVQCKEIFSKETCRGTRLTGSLMTLCLALPHRYEPD